MTQVATSAADSDRREVIAERLITVSMVAMTAFCLLRQRFDRRDAQWVRYRRNPALDPQIAAVVQAVLALPVTKRKEAA